MVLCFVQLCDFILCVCVCVCVCVCMCVCVLLVVTCVSLVQESGGMP